jgi:SNF2 family DNA or RNA helicase
MTNNTSNMNRTHGRAHETNISIVGKNQAVQDSSTNGGSSALRFRVRHEDFGLGLVEALDAGTVKVRFDSGEVLTFNRKSINLERVRWQVGQPVVVQARNLLGTVRESRVESGAYIYTVQVPGTAQILSVHESGLTDAPGANDAADLLAQGKFEDSKLFYFRTMGHYLSSARRQGGVSRVAARVLPKAHQISVAQRVLSAPRPRFLLADEVGLGKTIEAGLILQELRARGGLERVLIVVPTNLVLQWTYELRYKFNEPFKIYDTARVRDEQSKHPGENIWSMGRNIICSHSFITNNPALWDDILETPWDMVIFDEAHHIRRQLDSGNRRSATGLYRFASQISQRTRGLLLLTATPMQLHPFELYSLVELVDQTLFFSYEYFEEQRKENILLNSAIKHLTEIEQLDEEESATLESELHLLLPGAGRVLNAQIDAVFESEVARDAMIERLMSKHLLSEVMIRNRKRQVGGFTRRVPRVVPVELSQDERKLFSALSVYLRSVYGRLDPDKRGFYGFLLAAYQKRLASSIHSFKASLERRLKKLAAQELTTRPGIERRINAQLLSEWDLDEIMRDLGDQLAFSVEGGAVAVERAGLEALLTQANAIGIDSKYIALESVLTQLLEQPGERVLIFTQFTDTLDYLKEKLSKYWAVAAFHGAMPPKEKDEAVGQFQRGEVQILISTEAGGEGRNLQFCHTLFNYDLPWNPMKVEQRIGRVDRIGQVHDVQIYNLSLVGTIEERVLDVLDKRIHAFEETIGGLDPILGDMEQNVQRIVLESSEKQVDANLALYADKVEAQIQRARKADDALRDFVMDWRSYDTQLQGNFEVAEQTRLTRHANKWSKALLKHIGATIQTISEDSYSVKLGKWIRMELPESTRDTYQITFNYDQALEDSLVEYGSFGHPLFDALLNHATSSTFRAGVVARRTLVDSNHAGFKGFQFNFMVTTKSLHDVQRVIPVVIDLKGVAHPELNDLVIDSFDWQQTQSTFRQADYPNWEELVFKARDAAIEVVEEMLRSEVRLLKSRVQGEYEAEKRKIDQYCDYRETEGQRKIAHDEEIIARLWESGREEDRRVIPIWESNLESDRAYLATLSTERSRLQAELEKRLNVSYSYELLNAAWITIIAPASDWIGRAAK